MHALVSRGTRGARSSWRRTRSGYATGTGARYAAGMSTGGPWTRTSSPLLQRGIVGVDFAAAGVGVRYRCSCAAPLTPPRSRGRSIGSNVLAARSGSSPRSA